MNNIENSKYQIENKILNSLHASEPVLNDPEQLTNDIMTAIQDQEDVSVRAPANYNFLYRILVAASVALLVLFGAEEYIFLGKIRTLEAQASEISKTGMQKPAFSRLVLLNVGQQGKLILDVVNRGLNGANKIPLRTRLKLARINAVDFQSIQLPGYYRMRDVVTIKRRWLLNN